MGIMTLGALICVVASILLSGAGFEAYLRPEALLVVLGGTVFAALASYPVSAFSNAASAVRAAFSAREPDLRADVLTLLEVANAARRRGIVSLEDEVARFDDPYIKRSILLIVDGAEPELVRDIMQTELEFIRERHSATHALLRQMASFSTAFGMIGTLVGLINMLARLGGAPVIGPAMAAALVPTLLGALLANAVFVPLAGRLEARSDSECLRRELMTEGILAIADGENRQIIREKLNAFLSRRDTERGSAVGESPIAVAKRSLFSRQKRPQ